MTGQQGRYGMQGKSSLHEPSISAMLGYFLSPSGNHGLGDTFLRAFINLVNKTNGTPIIKDFQNDRLIKADVELEVKYFYNGNRKDIDIQISILDKSKEIHRIIIENKIKIGAANPIQLVDYYEAVVKDKDFKIESIGLTIVFLTPYSDSNLLKAEFENLSKVIHNDHNSVWIHWSIENDSNCVLGIIQSILTKELNAEINPINEYMRHTLKAFVQHVNSVTLINGGERKMRTGQDIGDIVDDVRITTMDGIEYQVIRRDSSQIQVFNFETGEKENARGIMSQYIDENKMNVEHKRLNTRMIGKKLLDILIEDK